VAFREPFTCWAGFLFSATIWAAMGANLIDHQFRASCDMAGIAAGASGVRIIHGFEVASTDRSRSSRSAARLADPALLRGHRADLS